MYGKDADNAQDKNTKQAYPLLCATLSDSSDLSASCSKESCVICLQSKREYAFVPCGHFCICGDCSVGVANIDGRCPICRREATHLMKIFK